MERPKLSNRFCPEGMTVEEWQVALRHEFARDNEFIVEHLDDNKIWGDYLVHNGANHYRVAFRGVRSDKNFCSCLDFRTNGLGTCKHIEAVSLYLQKHEEGYPWGHRAYTPRHTSLYVSYKGGRSVRLSIGISDLKSYESFRRRYFDSNNILLEEHYPKLEQIYEEGLAINGDFRCYDDVWEFVEGELEATNWQRQLVERYPDRELATDYALTCTQPELRHEMFEYLLQGNGIVVGEMTTTLRKQIIAIIDYTNSIEAAPSLIVAEDAYSVSLWKRLIQHSPLRQEKLNIVTPESFNVKERFFASLYNCIFIENADLLKEWHNKVSITIKRLKFKHLYMHLKSVNHLTPVQFSSIAQHISPYIIGPFYRFIRDYRPLFPLLDNGENFPDILHSFVFCRTHTELLTWGDFKGVGSNEGHLHDAQKQVEKWLHDTVHILNDDQARQLLIEKIEALLSHQ